MTASKEPMLPAQIQHILDKKRKLREEIESVTKSSLKDLFVGIFTNFPQVQAIRWTQYTPHFNDGEPCVFSVHEPDVQFVDGTCIAKKKEDMSPYPEEDLYANGEDYYSTWICRIQQKSVTKAVDKLYEVLQEIDEIVLAVFGDGVQVTVARHGEIEVDDYDHD